MPPAPNVIVAAPNRASADAGARMGAEGGCAVDAAVAAMLVALVTEPGIVSLAGGAFITVLPGRGEEAVTIDGYVEMPGRGLPPEAFGQGLRRVVTTYGGRTDMTVGPGSVATPGALAALEEAHRRWGKLAWRTVLEPAQEVSRRGFPLGTASAYYFSHVREAVFGQDAGTRAAIHHSDGRAIQAGEVVKIPDLAAFLDQVAEQGAAALYRGEVARSRAAQMAASGGLVTVEDLTAYRPIVRRALRVPVGPWTLATNPPPAIGGPVLAAMLLLLDGRPRGRWTDDDLAHLLRVLRAVLRYRAQELDAAADRLAAGQVLLDGVVAGGQKWLGVAPSTAHVSVVDVNGAACSLTASFGYGAGMSVPGTGLWLNNCLGEHELNPGGPHSLAPGARLASNMAPTVGVDTDARVLAIGSPGADRITTALTQVIASLAGGGYGLQEAIDLPRMHVRRAVGGAEVLEHEEDLPIPAFTRGRALPRNVHAQSSMYFGGVGVALSGPDGYLEAAADRRRSGAIASG